MWVDGQEIQLNSGDFLYVFVYIVYFYCLDFYYIKMVGVLVSGLFELFFWMLGELYVGYSFLSEFQILCFDCVLQNIEVLDLKVLKL